MIAVFGASSCPIYRPEASCCQEALYPLAASSHLHLLAPSRQLWPKVAAGPPPTHAGDRRCLMSRTLFPTQRRLPCVHTDRLRAGGPHVLVSASRGIGAGGGDVVTCNGPPPGAAGFPRST